MRSPNQPMIVAVFTAGALVSMGVSMAVSAATPAPTATVAPPSTAKVASISVPRLPTLAPVPAFAQAVAAQQQKQVAACKSTFVAGYGTFMTAMNACIATNEAAYNALTIAQLPATCQFYGFSTITACSAGIATAITQVCESKQSPGGAALMATYKQCQCNAGVTSSCN
jgi:hypothetical protein